MAKLLLPPDGRLRAKSIREPWATCIAGGVKVIENSTWQWPSNLPLPCTLAIHASSDDSSIGDDIDSVVQSDEGWALFDNDKCKPGVHGHTYFYSQAIVGLADVVAAVDISRLPRRNNKALIEAMAEAADLSGHPAETLARWANGPYCFVMANHRRFKQGIVCRGQLKIWSVPDEVQAWCEKQTAYLKPPTMPTPPHVQGGGMAKCLGKANYTDLARRS